MNKLDKDYQDLLQDILDNGVEKKDRTGTGTLSVFGKQIRHKMSDGFSLLTTKKLHWKSIVTELLWFLNGRTDLKWLQEHDNTIWVGDAYKNYRLKHNFQINQGVDILSQEEFINKIKTDDEFAKTWGELGPIYGKQWRKWGVKPTINSETGEIFIGNVWVDQIQNLINDLKTNPDSRRLMVSAWNVGELDQMVLPPCHYGFQVYTRDLSLEERFKLQMEKVLYSGPLNFEEQYIKDVCDKNSIPTRAISLMFNMRSNDVPLGLPFNLASYGLLLEILAKQVNMVPDELIANLGDAHIYLNQIDGVKEQLTRTPMKLPNLIISDEVNFNGTIDEFLESCNKDSFKLDGYESHPPIKIPLSN